MYRKCKNARGLRQSIVNLALVALATLWLPACAQTPEQPARGVAAEPVFTAQEIADLVAPIALYPDDLLAIVLPASTYPLQIVEAQRFLDAAASDPALKPREDWDDSVVALLNYPEVVKRMNDDLDWTQALGEAVLAQQPEVLAAIEGFRNRAYTSGNLRSDDRQIVEVEDDAVRIRPADPKVIYVPYYEPAAVTVYHSVPAYYYYPRPYPVYYYPYPADYVFATGFFWGVTTFYSLGWSTHHVHVYHYDYHDHPFYGRPYYHQRHYYRRPPPPRMRSDYRVNDGSWERHEYPREGDRQYYDRDGNRTPDGYTARTRTPDGVTTTRDPADTYWRPDYRRTGARPGTDPRRATYRRGEPRQQRAAQALPSEAPGNGEAPATPDARSVPNAQRRPQDEPQPERDRYREGSLQQRMEAQRRGEPIPAPARNGAAVTQERDEARVQRRIEQQEQARNPRPVGQPRAERRPEPAVRAQQQDAAEESREQARRRYEQPPDPQQGTARARQQYEQREQEQSPQEPREQQERAQQQERQQQEQQRRYEQGGNGQPRRDRTQQPFEQPQRQLSPQSWQQQPRQFAPQQRSGQEVRTQQRPREAPRNDRSDVASQRMERAAPQPEQRRAQARTEPRGERNDDGARNDDGNGESGGRSVGREAGGGWMRH